MALAISSALPFARLFSRLGIPDRNVVIWDRTNRELKAAGYALNADGAGPRVFGTATAGEGYDAEPFVHRTIASRISSILTGRVTASVSFAVLKDHGLAGVTAGMKNYFGAIHNPNKYHDDHCDPFVAELFDAPPVTREVQFNVEIFFPKEDRYRPLGEVSPVIRSLATEQFDDYVKRVRIFAHPRIVVELRDKLGAGELCHFAPAPW